MRDIVATIQPEQDDIVRADAATTVCVQGAPGTGKTAVGLHRVAYLLYAHKEQVTRRGVIVVGPNLAFLSYIRNVLPALGELDVTQTTVTQLVASVPVKGTDTDEAAAVKGDARMAELLKRALWAHLRAPREPLVAQPRRPPAAPARARDRGARPRAARPRRPLRHRPRAARAPDRARAAHPARGGRRDVRRPHPRRGPPVRAGAQVRGRGLAQGRSRRSWSSPCFPIRNS